MQIDNDFMILTTKLDNGSFDVVLIMFSIDGEPPECLGTPPGRGVKPEYLERYVEFLQNIANRGVLPP